MNNQIGWYILDTKEEQYLVAPADAQAPSEPRRMQTLAGGLNFTFNTPQARQAQPIQLTVQFDSTLTTQPKQWTFLRLSTSAAEDLSILHAAEGVDGLLTLDAQQSFEYPFGNYLPTGQAVAPPAGIDFNGAFGDYYWELFFFIPLFIANQLSASQRFEDARKWYQYIFDPTAKSDGSPNPGDRFWRFLPFRSLNAPSPADLFTNQQALAQYHQDPLDPHAIARLRINAYQKAVVMQYINNLLDWGDDQFRQESQESVAKAALLYMTAQSILGPRPASYAEKEPPVAGNFEILRSELAAGQQIPDFVLGHSVAGSSQNTASPVYNPNIHMLFSFGVPENGQFVAYWDRVADRLNKIRHSMDINGIPRKLPLFPPPIDPAALISALAGGASLGSVALDPVPPVGPYRFSYVLERARLMAGNAASLGSSLLAALEKKDGEDLTLLRNTQEKSMLDLMESVRVNQRDEAQWSVDALQESLANAQDRQKHYDDLISQGLSDLEETQLAGLSDAIGLRGVATTVHALGATLSLAPQVDGGASGFGGSPKITAAFGGHNAGSSAANAAQAFQTGAEVVSTASELVGLLASFARRKEEWTLQQLIAGHDVNEIQKQIEAAQLRLTAANGELDAHHLSQQQNQDIDDFLQRKFTSSSLYSWMANSLSSLYFGAYQLAYDLAQRAEAALQFELGITDRYVRPRQWDGLRKGLVAAESLLLDLSRLEKAAMDAPQGERFLEIEKPISLLRLNPTAFATLKTTGACDFVLDEPLFSTDFPGHYNRRLKTLAITIPAIVGPYETINATLTQTSDWILLRPDQKGLDFMFGVFTSSRGEQVETVRSGWRGSQQIALSRAVGDAGVFQLSFGDERYLPFEGTGAVSGWHLEIPQESNRVSLDSISDIILQVSYMARFDGGLKGYVQNKLRGMRKPGG